jgi:hypothetical protein
MEVDWAERTPMTIKGERSVEELNGGSLDARFLVNLNRKQCSNQEGEIENSRSVRKQTGES